MSSITAKWLVLQVALALLSLLWGAAAVAAEPKNLEEALFSPTVKWLPEPTDVANSKADTEAQMKPYAEVITGAEVKFDMLPIPGGKFLMGSPKNEPGRKEDEGPQHEVEIAPFWMGKCEVTWDEFESWECQIPARSRTTTTRTQPTAARFFCDIVTYPSETTDMTFGMGRKGYPAVCMTQLTAKVYCKWLSMTTGRYYRLPTEAEWEYACRAGTKTVFSFGDDPAELQDYGWYFDNSDDKYQKVGQKKPNPWGLYDMHGNVAEWVLDQYLPDFYAKAEGRATRTPLNVPTQWHPRAIRGGSWTDDPGSLRSAARLGSSKDFNRQDPRIPQSIWHHTDTNHIGFRVVRPLRKPSEEQCKRYELTENDIEVYSDYVRVISDMDAGIRKDN